MNNSSKYIKLGLAFREKREAMGLGLKELADELDISPQTLDLIETCGWSGIPQDKAYKFAILIAQRLNIDLKTHNFDPTFFLDAIEELDTHPTDTGRERIVLITMTTAATVMLAWLLIPAKDISQSAAKENQSNTSHHAVWQKPVSDQPYPVLGEVMPEIPFTSDGALISLRATDTCNARIVPEKGQEQNQLLRMSDPWTLRVKGAFVLHLDNAGVVVVEVAGHKIQHGLGVGKPWSGSFDANGNWLLPLPPPRPLTPSRPVITDDDNGNIAGKADEATNGSKDENIDETRSGEGICIN